MQASCPRVVRVLNRRLLQLRQGACFSYADLWLHTLAPQQKGPTTTDKETSYRDLSAAGLLQLVQHLCNVDSWMVSACQQLACRREADSRSTHQELTCICKPHTQCVSTRAFILLPKLSKQPLSCGLLVITDARPAAAAQENFSTHRSTASPLYSSECSREEHPSSKAPQHVMPMMSRNAAQTSTSQQLGTAQLS